MSTDTPFPGNITEIANYPCVIPGCKQHAAPNSTKCYDHTLTLSKTEQRPLRYGTLTQQMRKTGNRNDIGEEIDVARVLLASVLSTTKADDPLSLATVVPQASVLLGHIQQLVLSSVKIESFTGQVLTIDQVKTLLQSILEIILEEIPDNPELLSRIAARFQTIQLPCQMNS